ncbi:immunity 22 family protein [Winogradskyella sediminis]|uniref:immunity 22 family protein n=1 Tax=Winogradskyella sediminis TaxID=1382466 RepID=UPI000E22EEE7|nr:immunity 22 family protein [Winogradskyella sediminis]REG89167.1 immunity protein 22 of polymorphic toxin system [Winogradskyella sediminis]
MTKKIICVWIGTFESEDELYKNYLNFDYENDDNPESEFAKDSELEYYDEDFMESWWFSKLELNKLTEYKDDLLDSEYFFDELIAELKNRDLTTRNSISFLFGENGENATNETLFEYNGMEMKDKPIEFVFKKEYELK